MVNLYEIDTETLIHMLGYLSDEQWRDAFNDASERDVLDKDTLRALHKMVEDKWGIPPLNCDEVESGEIEECIPDKCLRRITGQCYIYD